MAIGNEDTMINIEEQQDRKKVKRKLNTEDRSNKSEEKSFIFVEPIDPTKLPWGGLRQRNRHSFSYRDPLSLQTSTNTSREVDRYYNKYHDVAPSVWFFSVLAGVLSTLIVLIFTFLSAILGLKCLNF